MATIRFFHEIYGNVHELPDGGPFPYERGLQEFFEKHLRTLTGVEFLDSEYSTGPRHSRRIDTLGIDGAGRPVVVEYKRRQDENVINQGLDYLAWLEDHRAEFRELVREKLGDGRIKDIDFTTPRLLCVASEFLRQDRIAAENSRRRIELLRYRRYGEGVALLRRRPKGRCERHGKSYFDPSKAWWGGRRGWLADRRCYPISVSPCVVPLVLVLRGSPGTRSRGWLVAPGASGPPRLQPGASVIAVGTPVARRPPHRSGRAR